MLNIRQNRDIWITRGDDGYVDLEVRQQNFPYEVYELQEGDTVLLTVRKSDRNDIPDFENPILFQLILEEGRFHIERINTEFLSFGNYVYDVQLTFFDGTINTIVGPNIFRILPEVNF